MALEETLELSGNIRSRAASQARIGVTELARGTAWRSKLEECKLLEVVERGATAGWLLSSEGMQSLLDTIAYFEAEAERAQVACLLQMRSTYDDWKTGTELRDAVDSELESMLPRLKEAFDGR